MPEPDQTVDVDVDPSAPVVTGCSIHIDAPCAAVWAVLADVAGWPQLTAQITAASPTPLDVGQTIHWQADGWTVASTIQQAEPPHRLAWRGHNQDGTTGTHVWTLEQREGGCRVTTRESLSGAFDAEIAQQLSARLEAFLTGWLSGLREHVQASWPASQRDSGFSGAEES